MLTTITATPRDTVQPGARSASKAVMSHAHANANVAIIGRASDDTLGLETAAASTSKITTSANTLNSPIEEVMAAAPPPAPHANRRSQRRESPLRTAPTTRGAGPLRRRQAPIADLRFGDESPDGTWRSCIFPSCLQASVEPSLSPGPGLDQRLATVWSLTMPPVPKPSRDAPIGPQPASAWRDRARSGIRAGARSTQEPATTGLPTRFPESACRRNRRASRALCAAGLSRYRPTATPRPFAPHRTTVIRQPCWRLPISCGPMLQCVRGSGAAFRLLCDESELAHATDSQPVAPEPVGSQQFLQCLGADLSSDLDGIRGELVGQ